MPTSPRCRLLAALIVLLSPAPLAFAIEFEDIHIPYEQFTLDNGLRVIVHTDRKAPIVAMNTWYHVGSKDEPDGRTGFAHLFEHLMFQGSEHFDDDYFKALNDVGATGINGTTNFDRTNYFQTVPTGALERLLWLESDRMTHLMGAVNQEKLDEQRKVVKNEKRQRENQPFGKAWEQTLRGVFPPGHPYRRTVIGSMEDLDAATIEDVSDWFGKYYGASNAVIVLAGDIDAATARPLVEKYYGDAPAGEPLERLTEWIPELTENRREILYDRAATGFLRRSWPVPSAPAESAGFALWGNAFAAGRTAPLYKALVEEHRLASSVYASPIDFEVSGVFSVSVQLLPDADAAEAGRILDETMAAFLATGPDPERLGRFRTQTLTSYVRGLESAAAKASVLISGAVYADNPTRFRESLEAVRTATSDGLSELANTWLRRPYYELTGLPFPRLAAGAGSADRSTLPEPEPAARLTFPEVSERRLDNGIRIVLIERRNLPTTELALRFAVGTANDTPDTEGLAQITFSQLTSGTTSRDAAGISIEMERLGSHVRASTGYLDSTLTTGGLTENLPDIVALLADLLTNPTFPEDQFTLQAERWAASIAQYRTQPDSIADAALQERVYGPEHVYGRQITEEAVHSLRREQAAGFHETNILGQPLTVFAVGDAGMGALATLFSEAFGGWRTDAPAARAPEIVPAAVPDRSRVFLIDMPQTAQSVIRAAHGLPPTAVEPDAANWIANQIIGGGFVSRINLNLREDKGWTYSAGTGLESDRYQPLFSVRTSVQADRTAESMAEMLRELREYVGNRPATPVEFMEVRDRNARSMAGRYETGRALLNSLLASADLKRPWNYPVLYDDAMRGTELEAVRTAARELIHPDRLTWVVVGDLDRIESGIRALGIGEVTEIDVFGNPVEYATRSVSNRSARSRQ